MLAGIAGLYIYPFHNALCIVKTYILQCPIHTKNIIYLIYNEIKVILPFLTNINNLIIVLYNGF